MLINAIVFIQNVQAVCFAVVFVLMAASDRSNRCIRWLALAFLSALAGGLFQFCDGFLPAWVAVPFYSIGIPIGYACVNAGVVNFVRRGSGTRWISAALILLSYAAFLSWSLRIGDPSFHSLDRISTLEDLVLSVQTGLTAWLLLSTRDEETALPRRVMGSFLTLYSLVELARVAVYLFTGLLPENVAPWAAVASGLVYVISLSVLPINFIWMINTRLHAHMTRQMTTDSLTQLLNRRGIEDAGRQHVARYLRDNRDFAVALVDIDRFKNLNDTFGHAAGDAVLCEVAQLMQKRVRLSDTLGRIGGEEFVLLLPATSPRGAATLIEELRAALAGHTFFLEHERVKISASFGVAVSDSRTELSWPTLLGEADQALYAAKHEGRNLCRFYGSERGVAYPPPGSSVSSQRQA